MTLELFFKDFENGLWTNPPKYVLEWDCIQSKLPEIEQFDSKDVLLHLFNNMNHSFNVAFILCAPSLWSKLQSNDWKYILSKVNRRVTHRYLIDDPHCFDDIFFLFRFIQVDSLEFVFETKSFNRDQKRIIFEYFKLNIHHLILDEFDLENMMDGTWANQNYFEIARKKLLADGCRLASHNLNSIKSKIDIYLTSI